MRTPRNALSASNGDGVAPCSTEYDQIASSSSCSPAITPSVASLWPAMPFRRRVHHDVDAVGERLLAESAWRTSSRPRSTGPLIAASSSRSTSSRRGFDGVSASTSIVRPGCTAAANAPGRDAVDQRQRRCRAVRTGPAGTRSCPRTAGAGRRCGRRSSRSPTRSMPGPPCPTRTPTRRRRPRARRSPPRTNARSGSSTGCRSRRPRSRGRPCVRIVETRRLPHARSPQRRRQRRSAGAPAGADRLGAGAQRVGVRSLERRAHTWHGSRMPVGRLQEVVIDRVDQWRARR